MSAGNLPHRVAVYAAPAIDSDWWQRGSQWLGRCAWQRCALTQPTIDGVDAATQAALTAEPRRYGWHGTLKAPWRLAAGVDMAALQTAVTEVARQHAAFDLPTLQVTRMGDYLALMPAAPCPALNALAADCVRLLQPLAQPLSEADLARRRSAGLTPEQDALLQAWGYPWVLQFFRFHFTLSGSLNGVEEAQIERLQQAATAHFADLPPLRLQHLSLFVEPATSADFALHQQVGLGA